MSNSPIEITTDLTKILDRIESNLSDFRKETNQKFEKMDERLNKLEVGQARLEETTKSLSVQISSIDRRVEKIESGQNEVVKEVADLKGAKSLVIPIVVAVITSLLTLLIRAIPNP